VGAAYVVVAGTIVRVALPGTLRDMLAIAPHRLAQPATRLLRLSTVGPAR